MTKLLGWLAYPPTLGLKIRGEKAAQAHRSALIDRVSLIWLLSYWRRTDR